MRATILNGSQGEDGVDAVHGLLVEEFARAGCEVESFVLRQMQIPHCLGCFDCWVRTPGVCVAKGAARDIARAVIRGDLAVFLTPVTFGGYSSELKKAVDHLIVLISPFFARIDGEVHHRRRYERYPRLLGVGVTARADEESERIFTALVHHNAINLHAPAHASAVVLSDEEIEAQRVRLRALLGAVEVRP